VPLDLEVELGLKVELVGLVLGLVGLVLGLVNFELPQRFFGYIYF
jgi:hypothetical protein